MAIVPEYSACVALAAWIVAQEADHDVDFQAYVLRRITPLVKTGEIGVQEFALRTDRVSLKKTGKQVFGTQLTATDDDISLLNNEIDSYPQVNLRRAKLGMELVEKYIKAMTNEEDEFRRARPLTGQTK